MIENIQPPIAKIIPTELEKFGDVRVDNYFWLKDRENPEVIDYLHKENDYYEK
jgi:oligopeptidase B